MRHNHKRQMTATVCVFRFVFFLNVVFYSVYDYNYWENYLIFGVTKSENYI